MNTPQKPTIVTYKEAQNRKVTVMNDVIQTYQLPFFLLEPIIKDIYTEVSSKAELEYRQANEQYKNAVRVWDEEHSKIGTDNEAEKSEN